MMLYEKELYHYLALHFPIALFITGYCFDLLFFIYNKYNFEQFGLWNLGLGIVWGIITIITGFITDNILVGHMESPLPIFTTHGTHMIVSIILFLILFIIRFFYIAYLSDKQKNILYFFHTLALIFFIHGTHIGAKLADRL